MQVTERIEVRKIYLGSALKFGLLYGLILGIIMSVVFLIGSLAFGGPGIGGAAFEGLFPGGVYVATLLILVSYTFVGLIGMLITALLYNLISVIGGRIHIGLAEYEKPMKSKTVAKPMAAKNMKTSKPAMKNQQVKRNPQKNNIELGASKR